MRILFIGGCLLTTKTVEKDHRFIQVLLSRYPGLQSILARYASFSLVDEVLSSSLQTELPNAVVFLVRPFPFYTLCKLFPRVPGLRGGVSLKLHPRILGNLDSEWFRDNDRLIVEADWNPNGTRRSFTHGINLKLGRLFRLDAWAIKYVQRKIQALEDVCNQCNIRLIVIGPPAVENDAQERYLLARLNPKLRMFCKRAGIPFVDLFSEEFPGSFLGPDKVHYTAEGHRQLAHKIGEQLQVHAQMRQSIIK